MNDTIPFQQLIPIENPEDYKLHLACWNGKHHPLDVYVRNRNEWDSWNSYRGKVNRFNRSYVISFIQFYHEKNIWLFGGIYKILSNSDLSGYVVERDISTDHLVGRIKVTMPRPGPRGDSFLFEKSINDISITELLKEPYSGEFFCGYENINHDFDVLETLFLKEKPDWKAALMNVKGVYVIFDKSNGKKYVGSAYGEQGIWSRWSSYMKTGHGGNDELVKLIQEKGINYARQNFKIALLEYRPMKTDDRFVLERENHWKELLLSRGKYGYNEN